MMLSNILTGESREVPISFQSVFEEGWLPLGEKLGLRTIPLYLGSIVARQGNTQEIIHDLHRLRDYLIQNRDESYAEYMMTNIDGLIAHLEEIEADPNLEGWFG